MHVADKRKLIVHEKSQRAKTTLRDPLKRNEGSIARCSAPYQRLSRQLTRNLIISNTQYYNILNTPIRRCIANAVREMYRKLSRRATTPTLNDNLLD